MKIRGKIYLHLAVCYVGRMLTYMARFQWEFALGKFRTFSVRCFPKLCAFNLLPLQIWTGKIQDFFVRQNCESRLQILLFGGGVY